MATMQISKQGRPAKKEHIAFNEMAIRNNSAILEYCRTSVSALSGGTAGVFGLTGLYGFAFYFIISFMISVMLLLKAGSQWQKYFRARGVLFTNGLMGGLFTYILFWTFLYGMVHVYWRVGHDAPVYRHINRIHNRTIKFLYTTLECNAEFSSIIWTRIAIGQW